MIVIEKIVFTDPQSKGHAAPFRATWRYTWVCHETEEMGDNVGRRFCCGFSRKGKAGQVNRAEDWLV